MLPTKSRHSLADNTHKSYRQSTDFNNSTASTLASGMTANTSGTFHVRREDFVSQMECCHEVEDFSVYIEEYQKSLEANRRAAAAMAVTAIKENNNTNALLINNKN